MGEALADVLLGRAEPGGRLPVTLPGARGRLPGAARRAAGRRARLRRGPAHRLPRLRRQPAPARSSRSAMASATPPGPTSRASRSGRPGGRRRSRADRARVRNTGSRPGREVVQAYLAGPPGDPAQARPRVWPRSGPSPRRPASAPRCRSGAGQRLRPLGRGAGGWVWPGGAVHGPRRAVITRTCGSPCRWSAHETGPGPASAGRAAPFRPRSRPSAGGEHPGLTGRVSQHSVSAPVSGYRDADARREYPE